MKALIAGLAAGFGLCLPLQAQVTELKGTSPEAGVEISLRNEARAAVDRAVKWLEAQGMIVWIGPRKLRSVAAPTARMSPALSCATMWS